MNEVTKDKKNILITAKNSYIGNSFANWAKSNNNYSISFISCRTDDWRKIVFSSYDVILHVAGIAHVNETKKNKELYYQVNRDLTIELALKAKRDGVKQFIFISTMSVYGIESGVISKDTIPNPKSNYGISKLQAEEKIKHLQDENFIVTTIRPPMVYGKNCKGNYAKLARMVLFVPVFPEIENRRSMIYIDNLSQFIMLVIKEYRSGVFMPQNAEYMNTSEMVKLISEAHGKNVRLTKMVNFLIFPLVNRINALSKLFGSLIYEQDTSEYCVTATKESIILSEA
ncbi:NAD-dependent epimerase/dehydratase family protein [Paenibacillus sp. 2TAB23]|uniref:NAD-dependent epimerase/dehydratase family protein n=1 Tax=Paenibacillus sp. 2TAB23 TaxID=3233004 RepID=UPI003F9D205A